MPTPSGARDFPVLGEQRLEHGPTFQAGFPARTGEAGLLRGARFPSKWGLPHEPSAWEGYVEECVPSPSVQFSAQGVAVAISARRGRGVISQGPPETWQPPNCWLGMTSPRTGLR